MPNLREPLELHAIWRRVGISPLPLIVGLFLALGAARAYGYFGPGGFSGMPIMISFMVMWLLPFVFLSEHGRHQIGYSRQVSGKWLLLSLLVGAVCSFLCYAIGLLLYGKTDHNWFVSVAYTYQTDHRLAELPRHMAFIAFTVPAMLASPIGEEIFFRGMVEQSTRDRLNQLGSACFAAALFAAIHLVHHGIYLSYDGLRFMPTSGAIWFLLMFATSLVFSFLRRRGDSIWMAITAHAAFNLVMNLTIFYSLFVSEPQFTAPQ